MRKLVVLALLTLAGCASESPRPAPIISAPAPNSLAGQVARPWHHVGGPVSEAKVQQDQAKCKMMGQMAPVGPGSPEVKFLAIFIQCMKAEGYAPD